MLYKTLLLDLDGTLVDSRADLVAAVNHTLTELGHPEQDFHQIIPRIGNGLRRLLADTIGLTDPEVLLKAKGIFERYYEAHLLDETVLYDGVSDVLGAVSNKLKLAVITNKPYAFAVKILDDLDVMPTLSLILGGDSLPQAKPDPEPLISAMQSLGAEPTSTLMVGDGIQDLSAGQGAGVDTCLVRYGFGFHEDLLKKKPTYTIHHFSELKEILQ